MTKSRQRGTAHDAVRQDDQHRVRKYAEFEGRATRPEFWWFIVFATLVSSALGALNIGTPDGVIAIGSSHAAVWAIATIVATLAVAVTIRTGPTIGGTGCVRRAARVVKRWGRPTIPAPRRPAPQRQYRLSVVSPARNEASG